MPIRPLLVLAAFAFFVASCGVSRNEATDSVDGAETDQSVAADDTGDQETPATDTTVPAETTAPPSTAPPTTGAPADVAATVLFADGSSTDLLHGQLNEIVAPTQGNQEFVTLVYQGAIPPGFDAMVLSQVVVGQVMDNELSKLAVSTSDANLEEARLLLFEQLEVLLASSADPTAEAERLYGEVPYLPFIAGLQARQLALSSTLAAGAGEGVGDPCVRHILVETEETATEVLTELEGGADFAELAALRSTGPTGPNGGDLGCAPAANYVPEFADAVTQAQLGAYIGPVETQFGWHVLVVDRYEVNGDQLANDLLTEGLSAAMVTVDERVGTWDVTQLTIVPVGS